MLENPQPVLCILRCVAFSFSPDPRISGFLLVILRDNIDICFTRFRFGFFVRCILSFVYFLSGYTIGIGDVAFFWARNFIRNRNGTIGRIPFVCSLIQLGPHLQLDWCLITGHFHINPLLIIGHYHVFYHVI
jgi:hypothetical protein